MTVFRGPSDAPCLHFLCVLGPSEYITMKSLVVGRLGGAPVAGPGVHCPEALSPCHSRLLWGEQCVPLAGQSLGFQAGLAGWHSGAARANSAQNWPPLEQMGQ